MPGDAADDYFDAEDRIAREAEAMFEAGCKRCVHPIKDKDGSCLVCEDLGWLDKYGEPIEP